MTAMLLQVEAVSVDYRLSASRDLRAVDDVTFSVAPAEALGIVGESGSGKSSLARAVLALQPLAAGRVTLEGHVLAGLPAEALRQRRRSMQMVFQDPLASLDPRLRVEAIVAEPLRGFEPALSAAQRRERVLAMLQRVGLGPAHLRAFPQQLSGGQAQRVGIARALVCRPQLLVCDEPVASLDVSIRAQVLDLLAALRREHSLAVLFIAHDLPAVRRLCDRVLVLYLGRVMEILPAAALAAAAGGARHPYTQALLAAAPLLDPALARARRATATSAVAVDVPSPLQPPSGCVFRTRCPWAIARCIQERPALRRVGLSDVACHRAEEIPAS